MNIKKICGSLAVAISMFALSATASAGEYFDCPIGDRDATVTEIIDMATALRCDGDFSSPENPGLWSHVDPIWQWKNKPENGCIVHTKLARLLYEERNFDDSSSKPRMNKNNLAKGAAQDLTEDTVAKDDSARAQLMKFIQDIGVATENPGHDQDARDFIDSAMDALTCIDTLP